jgi:isocitrate dehydrogenase
MERQLIPVAVAYGDGIGPEIMESVINILKKAEAPLSYHEVEIGEKVYKKGCPTGITGDAWNVIKKTKAFLKAPITTPQGGGFKSLNVTIRTTLGLFANVRPCLSYAPFITTKHPNMNLVVIRENEEDLYAGIEYRQTPNVCHSVKIISREGSERIIRYAFAFARQMGRKKVSCFTKDNIMKFSDGLFHKIFEEIAKEYPEIEAEHWIVDIGAAKLADTPEDFDVIVLPNLYGDILSDVAAQISGSVGISGSANIGLHGAMFEAIHGSAPKRAGNNSANPSGLILASVLMLQYLGEMFVAEKIHNAWLKVIEEGIHTDDIFRQGKSRSLVGTREFAEAVISFLGQSPKTLKPIRSKNSIKAVPGSIFSMSSDKRVLRGVDVYVYATGSMKKLCEEWQSISTDFLMLMNVFNRGVCIWPEQHEETFCVEQYRCRFLARAEKAVGLKQILALLEALIEGGVDIIKTENLYQIGDALGFSSSENIV